MGVGDVGTEDYYVSFQYFILTGKSVDAEVFELHMQELRAKQEEISKRDNDIKLLEAIIQTLGGKSPIQRTPRSSSSS